jgi:uncharacterized protein DUF4136
MPKLLTLLLCALLAACSSVHVATDHDPDADFSRLRTWAWLPRTAPQDPILENSLVTNRIRRAIEAELAAKGFRHGEGKSDFLVGFETASRDEVDVTTWPSWCCGGFRRRWGAWGHDVTVTRYTRGTLVVGVLDAASKDLLWRGTASRVLTEESGGEEQVSELVAELLEDFPPSK